MNMDRSSLLAIVACIIFFVAYQTWLTNKYPDMNKPPEKVVEKSDPARKTVPAPAGTEPPATGEAPRTSNQPPAGQPEVETFARLTPQQLTFDNPDMVVEFNQEYSAISNVRLKRYLRDRESEAGDFVRVLDSPMIIQGVRNLGNLKGARGFHGSREGRRLTFYRDDGDWRIAQQFTVNEKGYGINLKLTFENRSGRAADLTGGLLAQENLLMDQASGFGPAAFVAQRKTFIYSIDGDRDFEDAMSFCDDDDESSLEEMALRNERIDFFGLDFHYFVAIFHPMMPGISTSVQKTRPGSKLVCPISLTMGAPMGQIPPGGRVEMAFEGYFGPKEATQLAAEDPVFAKAVNYESIGIDLSWISIYMLKAIRIFYDMTHNYGIAIMLVTLIIKILFYPLTKAAAVSMRRMQVLQPEMTKLREKYKSDPQKQQQELMRFMSANKANPMKGCLPILPQMPVFFAFYSVLSQAIELRHAPFFGWIQDLSVADPYYISPLFLGAMMFVQQKIMPKNPGMDPNQQKIMMMMPVIFTVMMLGLPAGMVIYMIVNTMVSIAQQQWLNRKLENMEIEVVRS